MKENKYILGLKRYFKDKLLRKTVAFVMLLFFNFNIFSEIIPDPVSIGTKVTKSTSGIDQIDIAAPNKNGTSYNSLKELQVSEQGLILNNNKHVVVNTHIAGLVARNRNLDGGMAANLIITEVTGKNRTNINGIVEVAGQRADLVMANRNGIYINGGGFLNTDRVTLTTGKLEMNDGNLVSINVSEGHIGIGERGVDALSLSDLELLSKTIDIAGVIKASKETKVLISTGGQTYEYRTKEVKSKGETYKGIAVDGKAAGSMYAGKIDIISNDKGAGVNTKGDLVSVDDITLTASGDITTNKVNAGKGVAYKSTRKVRIKGTTSAGQKVQIKSKETEISAKVVTGYLEKALGKEALEIESEKTKVNSEVEAQGKVSIKSRLTENSGNIFATEKVEVSGEKFDNSNGELRSNKKIDLNVKDTKNVKGYILSDGLTKEDVKKEEETKEKKEQKNNEDIKNKEIGVNVSGTLDNTEGVIKGREITIGGNLTSNSKGKIDSIGALTLNGKVIDNKNGVIKGNIKKVKADKLINDEGQLLSDERIEGIIKQTSNIRGEIFGNEGVKLVGEKLNNLTGIIRSNGKIDTDIKHTGNIQGFILSDGITKEEAEKWQVQEKVSEKKEETKKEEVKEQTTGVILKGERLENTKGIIASLGQTTVNVGGVSNKEGKVVSRGVVELITPNEYVYEGLVEGDYVTTLKGKKITINEKINRNNTLELIAENGINLKEDIVSRILNIDIKSDLKNTKEIKGTDTLSVTAKNIENEGNLLSDKKLYVTAENKVINKGTGLIKGHESTRIEGNIIENNRGKILSEGSLTLIAETLIRNELGKIYSKGDLYGEVRKGNFENVGMSEVEKIDEVKEIPVVSSVETNRKGFYGFGRRRNNTPKTVQITERKVNVHTEDSDITGEGNIVIKAEKGALVNKDGGRIEGKTVSVKALNVYNIGKYIQDEKDSNHIVLATGGRIKGSDVYMEVSGKVVNGTEEYLNGTYRREDGVLVDNRKVGVVLNPSVIAGTQSTTIKAGSLLNTSQIGAPGHGATYVELTEKGINASIGNNIGKIEGKEVLVEGNKGITNIGGEIRGSELTQVTSKEGKVLNESTISLDTLTRERSVNLPFRGRKTYTEVYGITENIRNIGKIEGNGIVYVEGKEVENIAGNIKGKTGTVIKSTEKDIVDKTITLRDERKDVSETVTVTKQVRDTKTVRRGGRDGYEKEVPYGPAKTVQVQETRHWDTLNKTKTVSGEIGEGSNTVLDSKRDLILQSSNIRGKDNIVLNAKRYILLLSTIDTEYKEKSQTTKSGGRLKKKKVTTEHWEEDNIYANNVDLTSEGNILFNFKETGESGNYVKGDNKGVLAQGVNFHSKGEVIGFSDGDIFIEGTKDTLKSVYNSHTRKSLWGIGYGKSSDYVSDSRERYRLSQLYNESGIRFDTEGKLKVVGADIQTSGHVYLRGKKGLEVLPGVEKSLREEEHKISGIKGSIKVGWNGISAGVGYGKSSDKIKEVRSEIISNKLNVAGNVTLKSEEGNIDLGPTDGSIGGKLTYTGKDIRILDMHSERVLDRVMKNTYVGVGVNVGIPLIGATQQAWEAGKGLKKAKHKEDYINAGFGAYNAGMGLASALGGVFTNPFAVSGSINVSSNRSTYHREESISVGSNLHVRGGVEYNGENLHTRGLNILNEGDTVYNITGQILKEAGKSTIKESSNSTGFGLSVAKGMLDQNGKLNVFKDNNITATPSVSRHEGENTAEYYSKNEDITKGNSHYNNTGSVKTVGVDVKTGSISGVVNGTHETISVQDKVDGKNRGYNLNIGIGVGTKGPYISSAGAGYSRGDVTRRITNNVAEFRAGSGILDVKGKIIQVGSLIEGDFSLNGQGYEKQDLHDIDKSRNIGINVTVYPNTGYKARDEKGKEKYDENTGIVLKEHGMIIKTGINYGEKDKSREVLSTIGSNVKVNQDISNVNRDINRQTGEFEGRGISQISVDLGTEYWLTKAGRGKSKDIFEEAGRTVEGIKEILTRRDKVTGEYDLAGNIISEGITRRLLDRGFISGRGKKIEQVAKEIEARYGDLTKKGIKVRFYGEGDIDTTNLSEEQLRKLKADGIATTGDGYIWINKEKIKDGNTINFNEVISHEVTHQILGKDTEYNARYVEGRYGKYLGEIKENDYLKDGKIIDLLMFKLTDEDKVRLNKYTDKDMQYKIFFDNHKDITDGDRKELLTEMQKITNYELEEKKMCKDKSCTYEVVRKKDEKGNFIKKGEREYKAGNKLIEDLLETKEEISITNQKDPNKWVVGSETSGAKGTKAKIDMTDNAILMVWDSVNKRAVAEEEEKFIEIAHELTHIHRFIFGRFAWDNTTGEMKLGTHWAINENGIEKQDIWVDKNGEKSISNPSYGLVEEYATVGIGNKLKENAGSIGVTGEYNVKGDITENMIRKEHGIRYRVFYRTDEPRVKEKKKRDEIYNNFLKRSGEK